jgi:hypothetical protein
MVFWGGGSRTVRLVVEHLIEGARPYPHMSGLEQVASRSSRLHSSAASLMLDEVPAKELGPEWKEWDELPLRVEIDGIKLLRLHALMTRHQTVPVPPEYYKLDREFMVSSMWGQGTCRLVLTMRCPGPRAGAG